MGQINVRTGFAKIWLIKNVIINVINPDAISCLYITWTHSRGTAPRRHQTRPPSGRSCRMCRLFLRSRKERIRGSAALRTSGATACWVVRSYCLRRCDRFPPRPGPGGRQSQETTLHLLFLPVRHKWGWDTSRETSWYHQHKIPYLCFLSIS